MRNALFASLAAALFALGARAADTPPAKPYEEAVKQLDALIRREVEAKGLPALSVALVDDQTDRLGAGLRLRRPAAKTPATADTVYRVGSVSKLFTDLAVMQLVEQRHPRPRRPDHASTCPISSRSTRSTSRSRCAS